MPGPLVHGCALLRCTVPDGLSEGLEHLDSQCCKLALSILVHSVVNVTRGRRLQTRCRYPGIFSLGLHQHSYSSDPCFLLFFSCMAVSETELYGSTGTYHLAIWTASLFAYICHGPLVAFLAVLQL